MNPTPLEQANVRRLLTHLDREFARVLREGNLFDGLKTTEAHADLAKDVFSKQMQFLEERKVLQSSSVSTRGIVEGWQQLKDGSIVLSWSRFGNETRTEFRRKPRRRTRVYVKRVLMGQVGLDVLVQPVTPVTSIQLVVTVKKDEN